MELYQLKSFLAVAEHGNVTRAAESLFTSQPAVSAQIKALEQSFGVQLFHRTPSGMTLTDPGVKLLEHARQTLAQAKATADLARHLRGGAIDALRIGLNDAGPRLRLEAVTRALLEYQPDLELHFESGASGNVLAGIRAYDLDVGFYEGPCRDPAIAVTSLGEVELCIAVPREWSDELDVEDWHVLARVPWVFNRPECSYHNEMARLCDLHGLSLQKQFRLDHDSVSLHMVRDGLAVSMVDRAFAQPHVDAGDLAIWPHYSGRLPWSAINLKKRHDEPAIAAFRSAVTHVFQPVHSAEHA